MTFGDHIRQKSDEELAEMFTLVGMGHTPEYTVIPYNPIDKTADYWSWLRYLKREAPEQKQQKATLCLSCKHGEIGAVDDFATCYCPHHGYVGQKTECGEYEGKEGKHG